MGKEPAKEEPRITEEGQMIRPQIDPVSRDQGLVIILLLLVLVGLALWHTFKHLL